MSIRPEVPTRFLIQICMWGSATIKSQNFSFIWSGLTETKVVGKALRFDLWLVSNVSEELYDSVFWVKHSPNLMSSWNIYQEFCQKIKSRKLDIF